MGTTIAGNQHIGTNYKKMQYIWAPGLGGDNAEVELYEEDRIFVYQFNPSYDQRDDGVLAIEFYYYYRKPTTNEFWTYCYDADYYYIFPFLAWYDDTSADGGKWGGLITYDSEKISLVGRDTGWIHVTLHVDEYIWGRFTNNGRTYDNTIYIGIYSPIPVFVWDVSPSGLNVTPYEILWDFEEYEDEPIYDLITGGSLEDCYWKRKLIQDYPTFYITYRDVTPESFAYSVNEAAVMNVTSGITKKANFKKLLTEIKQACGVPNRKLYVMRNAGLDSVGIRDSFFFQQIFKRLFSDKQNVISEIERKHDLKKSLSSILNGVSEREKRILFFRNTEAESISLAETSKRADFLRLLEPEPNIESDVIRKQVLFRSAESESEFTARPFASRLFFRTVQTVMSFWDWLRGKIREANNVVTFFCPIDLEIEMECRI